MKPEERARKRIDQQLEASGWLVQDADEMNISAGLGVAIREFQLSTGAADYLLYADGKVIGVIEAKAEGHTLTGVQTQSAKYLDGVPSSLPHYRLPPPFAYESTGIETRFTNCLEPDARSRPLFTFHRPEELIRLVGLDEQVRSLLQHMPELDTGDLWQVQIEAIQNLERSLASNRPRSLIQMATGSGKTFTAVNFCYRLVKFAKARRILFLVDRNNLGKQTLNEFQQFVSPYNSYKFTEEYTVQHLKKNNIDPASKVCITTIQRLYSMLKGEEEYFEENEEASLFETESPLIKEPLPVVYNGKIPIETFDFIVIDECHRSIYNIWRQVLDYFDAYLIGLTATPTAQTIGFFNQNLVQEYTHEKAVVDGVNVGYDVYRIETEISKNGAKLARQPGVFVPQRDRRTKQRKYRELDDDLTYTANQLDRDVVAENQIRLVIQTFRDKLPEIFPGRTDVPKTLVFAKTDLHAEDVVRIIREEFGKGNDFCQKITSKSTGKKPDELLAEFRTMYNPRIAVTVDMIATGTDIKPLECLLFLRNIRSLSYFEQMKGRGCRVVDPDTLQSVTPDAPHKTHFVIVDAVGVCEDEKSTTKPLDRQPSVSLDKLLASVASGTAGADLASTLAARLARLEQEISPEQAKALAEAAGGKSLATLASELLKSIDADEVARQAAEKFAAADGVAIADFKPSDRQQREIEEQRTRAALKPFQNPNLRNLILSTKQELMQTIDEVTIDRLLRAGLTDQAQQKAKSLITSFREFIEENKDEIEALQVLYSQPYRAGLRFRHIKDLATRLNTSPFFVDPQRPESLSRIWRAFEIIQPQIVQGQGGKKLVDVIALVRHVIDPSSPLTPVGVTVEEKYQKWLTGQHEVGVTFSAEQKKWLDAIKDHIAASLEIENDDLNELPFNEIGGLGRAYELFGDKLAAILDELNTRLAA